MNERETIHTLEAIRTFWPIVYAICGAAIAFVVWLVRLEGKNRANYEKISQVKKTQGQINASAANRRRDTPGRDCSSGVHKNVTR